MERGRAEGPRLPYRQGRTDADRGVPTGALASLPVCGIIGNMKNQKAFSALSLTAALFASVPASAQDLVQDTLAIRIVLDQNGLTNVPVSQVATVESQRVTALDLSKRQLVALPREIGSLSALKSLTLADNLLDALPDTVWSLSNLVALDLGGNRIGVVNPLIANLKNLLLLGLRDNGLAAVPAGVYALPLLTTLLLAGNDLDTLSDSVANLAFLKYLDISGNVLKTVPYTLAAMDLDSLDLSSNILESLPELITQMSTGTKVHLASNRLCALSASLDAWAEGEEPGYKTTQTCGSALRPALARASGPSLRAFADGGGLRVDLSGLGNAPGTLEIVIRDPAGRQALRFPLAAGMRAASIPRSALGGHGFYWVELRLAGKTAAVAPVLPQ